MSVSIVIPRPVPDGYRVQVGERTHFPTCDRCLRTSSERNPVLLSDPRPSMSSREFARGVPRRDALCHDCRLLLKGLR